MGTAGSTDREFDVVIYGATGFVGRLLARYLLGSAPYGARIALGGRSRERLTALRASLGEAAADWPVVVADSSSAADVTALAERTRVVATTVGPYLKYGLPLAEACARSGTHSVDLTGEVTFARACIDRFHELAVASGARVVNSCGFDSVPSDLALLMAAERARTDGEDDLREARLVVLSLKGGLSGGTIDSLRTTVDEVRADRRLAGLLADPYALSPRRDAEPDRVNADWASERDGMGVRLDRDLGRWLGPFVMAPYNTRVVRRSNALKDWAYGRRLRYSEVMAFGSTVSPGPVLAAGTALGVGAVGFGLAVPPTRRLLDRVLPSPGEGPSEKTQREGHFTTRTYVTTGSGRRYVATVAAQGDPGYAATSVMLGESALSLAFDGEALPAAAGVLTPATAMGEVLVARLRAAGFAMTAEPYRAG